MQSWRHPKMLTHTICEFSYSGYLRSQHRMERVMGNKRRKRIKDTRIAPSTTLLLPIDGIPRVIICCSRHVLLLPFLSISPGSSGLMTVLSGNTFGCETPNTCEAPVSYWFLKFSVVFCNYYVLAFMQLSCCPSPQYPLQTGFLQMKTTNTMTPVCLLRSITDERVISDARAWGPFRSTWPAHWTGEFKQQPSLRVSEHWDCVKTALSGGLKLPNKCIYCAGVKWMGIGFFFRPRKAIAKRVLWFMVVECVKAYFSPLRRMITF